MQKTIVVGGVGANSGFSESLIKVLTEHGYAVLALARTPSGKATLIENYKDHSQVVFKWLDISDRTQLSEALTYAEQHLGPLAGYIHNASTPILKPFLETSLDDYVSCWETAVRTAVSASQEIIPRLLSVNGGAMIFMGATASVRGSANAAPFATSKFALRGLSQSLAREFGPMGIHVAHLVIDGIITGKRAQSQFNMKEADCINPDDLAQTCISLMQQPQSCWTHELDLRPAHEKF